MTFAAPLFLLAAAAGLIPVLLHMINRQKAPVLPFSTLRFLRLSAQRTRRRKYVNDLLLLLLRIAALVLIAVGLAKPAVHGLRSIIGGRASTAVAIVLDNSASMGIAVKDRTRWEAALDAAEVVLDLLKEGDSVALLLTCGPVTPESNRLYSNHEVVRQALGTARLSYEQANLQAKLQQARKLVEQSEKPNKEVYLITDMQAASWEGLTHAAASGPDSPQPASAAGDSQPTEADGDSDVPVVVVDVYGAAVPNVALRGVEVHSIVPTAGVPMQATVELFGAATIEQPRHVELYLDGAKRAVSPALAVPPSSSVKHTFTFTLPRPGLHRGEIRLVGDDACNLDDRIFFAVTAEPQIPVAVVKAESHEIPYLEDSFYLERALMPGQVQNWPIHLDSFTPAALAAEPLSNYAVVFCVNLPPPESLTAKRLKDYVQAGGHLFWMCGDNVDPEQYNQINQTLGGDLLPVPLAKLRQPPADRPDGWHIGSLDASHPALKPLTEPASLYQSVLVYKHVQLQSAEQAGARVLARLDDGEPLLVERAVGAGSVLLLGCSAHIDWTNLPLRPLFLPLMARLTFVMAAAESSDTQLLAGTPIVVPVEGEGRTLEIELTTPSGDQQRTKAGADGDRAFRYNDTHQVGIYRVKLANAARPRELGFAVNLHPDECDPSPLSRQGLEKRFGEQPLVICDQPDQLAGTIQRLREGESLWDLFLAAVLIALLAESFIANRIREQDVPKPAARRPARRTTAPPWQDEAVVFVAKDQ